MAEELKKFNFAFPHLTSEALANLTPAAINLMPEVALIYLATKESSYDKDAG